jgi:hypothetical protein
MSRLEQRGYLRAYSLPICRKRRSISSNILSSITG